MAQTNEEKQASIAALLEERRGYVNRGLDDRVAEVDAALKSLGAKAEKPQQQATRRGGGTAAKIQEDE